MKTIISIEGRSMSDIELALEEAQKKIVVGNTSGWDENDTGAYSFKTFTENGEADICVEADGQDLGDDIYITQAEGQAIAELWSSHTGLEVPNSSDLEESIPKMLNDLRDLDVEFEAPEIEPSSYELFLIVGGLSFDPDDMQISVINAKTEADAIQHFCNNVAGLTRGVDQVFYKSKKISSIEDIVEEAPSVIYEGPKPSSFCYQNDKNLVYTVLVIESDGKTFWHSIVANEDESEQDLKVKIQKELELDEDDKIFITPNNQIKPL